MTNTHDRNKDTFLCSLGPFRGNIKGLCQPIDFVLPEKGAFSEAGRTLPALWEGEGCSQDSLSCKSMDPEKSTTQKTLCFT